MKAYDNEDNQYISMRIPTKEGGKLNVYFRKYTESANVKQFLHTKKSMYEIFNSESNKKGKKVGNAPINSKPQTSKLGNIVLRKFENPLEKVDQPELIKREKDAILDDIPTNRTLFMINFDKPFEEKKLRKWFRTAGKIRHVFAGSYFRKLRMKESDNDRHGGEKHENNKKPAKQKVHFALVVFKNEKEITRCIEIPDYLQNKILALYKDINLKIDPEAKEKYQTSLVTKYGQKELKEKNTLHKVMEDDGFKVVGEVKEQDGFAIVREEEKQAEEPKPRKKKKAIMHDDFYKFQIKEKRFKNELDTGIDYSAFYNKRDDNVLAVQKRQLLEGFKKDVERYKVTKTKAE